MDEKEEDGIGMEDDKSELGTEQVADARKTYPIENARHNYAVENGNPQGMRFTAAMADKSAQRVSLKERWQRDAGMGCRWEHGKSLQQKSKEHRLSI